MQKLDPSGYVTSKWKNGRGTTTQAFVLPKGGSLDGGFDARVSMAKVESDGLFSDLPGVDRTIILTEGNGLILETADGATLTVKANEGALSFTGDDAVKATLIDGPVIDLNVMTRRAVLTHKASRIEVDADHSLTCPGVLTLLCVLRGRLTADDETQEVALSVGDILTLRADEPLVAVRPPVDGGEPTPEVLLVDLFQR